MKLLSIFLLAFAFVLVSCSKEEELPEGVHKVEALETMDSGGYTYMRVDDNGEEYWIAVPQMAVAKGDVFYYTNAYEMKDFQSKTLNRTFASILFVGDISKSKPGENVAMPHPKVNESGREEIDVKPLDDGITVQKAYQERAALNGKAVKIRGMVTKYNADILGKNWIHIQDGTGSDKEYDLTVTSSETANVGETVIIEGTLAIDKDFGSGYSYTVLVENAKIIREQ